jgi:hypothetical protein
MFQFPRFASYTYEFSVRYLNKEVGFPIRTFTGQSLLTAHRNFSQPATSFIASDRQGIHQMPFKTLEFKPRTESNPPLQASKTPFRVIEHFESKK